MIKSYSSDEDFPVCSRTLRNYIDKGLLTAKNIDLRRKISIRLSKNNNYPRTYSHNPLRKIDHLYDDYIHYMLQLKFVTIIISKLIVMKKTSTVLLCVLVVLLSSCGTKEITDPHEGYKVIEQVTFNLVKLSSLTFKSVSYSSNHIDYEYITETNTKVEFYSNNALYSVSKTIGLYDDQRGKGIKEYNNEAYAKLENGYITIYSVNDGVSSKYVGEYKGTIDELYLGYFPEQLLI